MNQVTALLRQALTTSRELEADAAELGFPGSPYGARSDAISDLIDLFDRRLETEAAAALARVMATHVEWTRLPRPIGS